MAKDDKTFKSDHICERAVTRGLRRPPGAADGALLAERCIACADCVSVCPFGLLRQDKEGYPYLAADAVCRQCGLCADVCSTGAIQLTFETSLSLEYLKKLERTQDADGFRRCAGFPAADLDAPASMSKSRQG